jgi:uncharacterized protein YbaR (Trm112 family)
MRPESLEFLRSPVTHSCLRIKSVVEEEKAEVKTGEVIVYGSGDTYPIINHISRCSRRRRRRVR